MMKDKKIFILGSPVLSILLLILILPAGFNLFLPVKKDLPGEAVATIPAQKIAPGTKHSSYLTNPPTSGWYTDSNLRDGIFTTPLTDEQIVEALTKGIVVISYNCMYKSESPTPPAHPSTQPILEASPSAQPAQLDLRERPRQTPEEAAAIMAQIREQNKVCGELTSGLRQIVEDKGIRNIIMVPRGKLDTRIALTAWGRLDKLLWFDKDRINRFIEAYRGKISKY